MNKLSLVLFAIISVAFLVNSAECEKINTENDLFDEQALEDFLEGEEEPECFCTREYNPLCASNGRTYSNDCLFRCEADTPRGQRINLRMLFRGECD